MKQAENRKINIIRSDRGFTLVELIVVLAVITIVSSVAVLSLVGYIDKARFDKNEQNAQSVFQAAQAAVNHKKSTGELEGWITEVLMKEGTEDPYYPTNSDMDAEGKPLDEFYNVADFTNFSSAGNNQGESVHMRYILTYKKGGTDAQSKALDELLSSYFYDTTVMMATFTIEFDVEKTIGSDGTPHYNTNAYAVFYDEGRSVWDDEAMKHLSCEVPYRDSDYRRGTSLVGYYNGGMPGAVDSVYVPNMDQKMEFAELALRNGEALELSFSAINDNMLVTGSGQYNVHYIASIYDSATDEKLADLAINEAALTKGTPTKNKPTDYSAALKFEAGTKNDGDTAIRRVDGVDRQVLYTVENLKDKNGDPITRYAATIESFALVYLNRGSGDFDYNSLEFGKVSGSTDFYRFPIKISYVINEDKSGNQTSYVAYSIALDSMMSRNALYQVESDTKGTRTKGQNYSISRLFTDTPGFNKTLSPKNIYVSMTVAEDEFTDAKLAECNVTTDLPESDEVKAVRALDDPVYLQADGSYKVSESAAGRDSSDGYAVVNTYFGDLGNGSLGSSEAAGSAAVTSFRHLYNIRFMEGFAGDVEYSVKRDLNWYSEKNGTYTSDVKVYNTVNGQAYLDYNSPVGKNAKSSNAAKLVMWPALPKLPAKQKIVAVDNSLSADTEDKTSVIRNLQMRRGSFLSTDTGLGFICENDGTIQNLRCENFMLTLDNTADGAASDVAKADSVVTYLIGHGNMDKWDSINALDKKFGAVPIGGLVGLNKGHIGVSSTDSDKTKNTVRMSNVNVLVGAWDGAKWKTPRFFLSTGGVIGEYTATAQSGGTITVDGYYAVSGASKVGGIIGSASAGVDAYLIVDTTQNTDKAAVDFQDVDAFIMGRYIVGGAVAYMNNGYFAKGVFAQGVTSPTYSYDDNGVVNIVENDADKYGVYVNLSSGSYIRQAGSDKDSYGNAGAVGQIENHTAGKALSVKVVNAGLILSDGSDKSRYVSAAVGFLNGGSASSVYINVENSGSIGTKDGTSIYDDKNRWDAKCYAAAAGIAYIKDFGSDDLKYVFNVKNSGLLYGGTNGQTQNAGIGLAVGAFDTAASPVFIVKAVNSGTIFGGDYVDKQTTDAFWKNGNVADYGVGGAIGFARSLGCSHIYAVHESGANLKANGNNVGGAVGCIRNDAKGNSVSDAFTVTSVLQKGVNVRADGINVGGCIGNMWNQGDYCLLRTEVDGDVTVSGYKNIGGVAGRNQQAASGTGACVYLQGTSATPELTLTAVKDNGKIEDVNSNVGGVIGAVGSKGGEYSTKIISPAQDGNDNLSVSIMGYSNVGGMAGYFYMGDLEQPDASKQHSNISTQDFALILNPASSIVATNNTAGGCIGFLEGVTEKDFASKLEVTVLNGSTENMISAAEYNAGGVIGKTRNLNASKTITSHIESQYAVNSKKCVGGAIGYSEGIGTIELITAELGKASAGSTVTPLRSDGYAGGCLGWAKDGVVVRRAETVVNTNATIIDHVTAEYDERNEQQIAFGGVVGGLTGNCTITAAGFSGTASEMNLTVNKRNVGGVAGLVETGSVISDMFETLPVCIDANCNVGGYVGNLSGGIIGAPDKELVINNIKTVAASNDGAKQKYGTGSLVGLIDNSGVVQWKSVEVTLNDGNLVKGGYNTGGIIGQIQLGTVTCNLDTHFKGGQVMTNQGGMGGVIGGMFGGEANGVLSTHIDFRYPTDDATRSALAGETDSSKFCKGVGGVVGQMGDDTDAGRVAVIKVNTMVLRFEEDFALLSGTSSVGGVLGQCETRNGEIGAITVKSMETSGNKVHKLMITPTVSGAYDVGGLIGYMLSPVPEHFTAENIDITVKGNHYVGGWIGGLDGCWGTKDHPVNIGVTGINSVTGAYGVGGVIGCLGAFNDGGKVYGTMDVDLKDAKIKATGGNGAGGAIGLIGVQSEVKESGVESIVYGKINVKLNNTKITGYNDAGGAIGCILVHGRLDDDCDIIVNVEGDSALEATNGSKAVGGIVGANEGIFLADIELKVSDGVEYKLSASGGGNIGTVMGRNKKVFGRLSSETIEVPEGDGEVLLSGSNTGAILGWNEKAGLCGLIEKSDGEYKKADSGTLTYQSNVELTGSHVSSGEYAGFVGKKEGTVNRVVMEFIDSTNTNQTNNAPTNTDPTNTDPTNTDPTNTDPANTDPTNTDPTNTDPTNTDPTNTDPTNTDPTNTDPTNIDPANTDPANTDPTNTDPTNTDSTNTDPTNTDPTNTDPTNTDPTNTDPTNSTPTNNDPTSGGGTPGSGDATPPDPTSDPATNDPDSGSGENP